MIVSGLSLPTADGTEQHPWTTLIEVSRPLTAAPGHLYPSGERSGSRYATSGGRSWLQPALMRLASGAAQWTKPGKETGGLRADD
jgi:hypothetical protein